MELFKERYIWFPLVPSLRFFFGGFATLVLAFILDGGILVLLILGNEILHVRLGFGEL